MTVTTHPASQTAAVGQSITFTAADNDTYAYVEWQRSTNGGTSWTPISGATSVSYTRTVASGENGNLFRCVFWDYTEAPARWERISNAATLTIPYFETGTLVDAGFEAIDTDHQDGDSLINSIWTDVGVPANAEYDTAQHKVGSQSAYLKGKSTSGYTGAVEATTPMTADGSEIRFWLYQANTNLLRRFYANNATGTVNGCFYVEFTTDGNINVTTNKTSPPTGYITGATVVGTQATGWTQYRLVFNFTGQTYTLSKRATAYGTWTQLKASGASNYDIPMRGSGTVTSTGGTAFSVQYDVEMWVDDMRYSASGIAEGEATVVAITAQPASITEPVGDSASFSVTATGFPLTYQWQLSTNGGSSFADISGATSAIYAHTALISEHGYQYRCVVTNTVNTVTSDAATLSLQEVSTTVQVMGFNDERTESATAGALTLTGPDMDATYLNSASPTTCHNALAHKVGYKHAGTEKYHYLTKPFIGGLLKGTVASAKLWVYLSGLTVASNDTLTCHRFANTKPPYSTYGIDAIATAWDEDSANWNDRLKNFQTLAAGGTSVPWQTAGATHADEIDATGVTLALTTSSAEGWYSFDLPAEWIEDWVNTDYYAQGVIIKATNEGTDDCYATVASPTMEVVYSAYAAKQYDKRKATTNTKWVTHPYAGERLITIPSSNSLGLHTSNSPNRRFDMHFFDEHGRVSRALKESGVSTGVGNNISYNGITQGLHVDPVTHRFWMLTFADDDSSVGAATLTLGYSDPYTPTNWTWTEPSAELLSLKSGFAAYDDVAHIGSWQWIPSESNWGVGYTTYTRGGSWSSTTMLVTNNISTLTQRTLSSAIDATTTTLELSGALTHYRVGMAYRLGTEVVWSVAIDGTSMTVIRDAFGTTGAAHASGTTLEILDNEFGPYVNMTLAPAHDAVGACLHLTHTADITAWIPGTAYTGVYYMRHYLADAANVWKNSDDASVTLPLRVNTAEDITGSDFGAWNNNLLVLDNGDILASYTEQTVHDDGGGLFQTDAKVTRIATSGVLGVTDLGFASGSVNMSDLGSGNVVFVGTQRTYGEGYQEEDQVAVARSEDYGAIVGTAEIVADHSPLTYGYLWELTMTETGAMNGAGMVAYHHENYGGAVYFQGVEYVPVTPSDVTATFDTDHIDLAWADNSTAEDGYYIERSVDGGSWYQWCSTHSAWELEAHAITGLAANSESYTDSALPGTWTSIVYRVAAYKGTLTSAWAESNLIRNMVLLDAEGTASATIDASLVVAKMLTAEASSATTTDAALTVIRSLAVEGSGSVIADALLTVARFLQAEASGTVTGDAAFAGQVDLAAEGTVTSIADAALQVVRALSAEGVVSAAVDAGLSVVRSLAAEIAASATGEAVLRVVRLLSAEGGVSVAGDDGTVITPHERPGRVTTTTDRPLVTISHRPRVRAIINRQEVR